LIEEVAYSERTCWQKEKPKDFTYSLREKEAGSKCFP
jgi:hypothetical protein